MCCFLGSWDSGSTFPGKPYIAKWPDKFGNLKQREVVCPDCIGFFFSKANYIDISNQLCQHELALEMLWHTLNPWFRIDCTLVGMTVIDTLLAVQYQAPPCANMKKMSVENFAQELVSDLWSFDFMSQPVSEIPAAALSQSNSVEPAQERITPTTFQDIILAHPIRKTTKRDTRNDLVRRIGQMKADSGCLGQSK